VDEVDGVDERMVTISGETGVRWGNLARRLGVSLEDALGQIAGRMDLMDRIAAALAVPVVAGPAPLRLRPAEVVSEEIAVITVYGNLVATVLPHADERFCEAVRRLRYRWDGGQWQRVIGKFGEPVSDRAVELGVHILAAGFPVEVRSEKLYQRIAAGEYQPETRNWLSARTTGRFAGWFCIQWDREGRDFFRAAALISGGRCYPGSALIPPTSYDEALDFAEVHRFAVSDGALDLAAKARREREGMLLVTPMVRAHNPADCGTAANNELGDEGILDELADEPL
jgi:hypothetical protein